MGVIYIYIYIYTHTVPSTNIGTAKAAVKIHLHCLSFIQTFPSYHWSKTIESRGKSHWEINAFSCSCWPQILAPNYCNVLFPGQQLWVVSYNAWRVWRTPDKRSETVFFIQHLSRSFRFTASPLQFTHSSSTGFRSENTWHEIRDCFLHPESLQIFRFTASSLQFTHSSSTGFRSENTWHEIRDCFLHPESLQILQIHSFFSSVHSLIFYRVQVREHLTRDQRPFLHPESLQILQIHSFFSSVHSLIFYRVQVREHLTRDQRPFLHPESLQIFRFTASSLQFTSLIFYRVQVREHLTRDQRPFLHPESLQIFRFTASPLQFTSLIFYRVQVREHLTRDQRPFLHPESLQILQIHSFFSSVHLTHLLQGSDQRTPDTRSETIPSSRITPDLQIHSFFSSVHLTHLLQGSGQRTPDTRSETIPSSRISPDLQIHSFFSSVHLTHLLQGSGQRTGMTSRSLVLCSVTHVCFGLLSLWKIQTRSIIRFLIEAVRFWFFICIPVCTKTILSVCCQKALFQFHLSIEASPIRNSSRVFGWVRRIFLETLPNNTWWFN